MNRFKTMGLCGALWAGMFFSGCVTPGAGGGAGSTTPLYGYLRPRVQDDARRGNGDQTPQLQSGGEDLILLAR